MAAKHYRDLSFRGLSAANCYRDLWFRGSGSSHFRDSGGVCTECSTGMRGQRYVSVVQNMKRSEHEEDVIRKHSERQTHRNFMFLFR
jgi:hypothetical protein